MHTSAAEIKMIGIDIFMLYSILSKGGLLSPITFAVSFLMAFFAIKYFMKLLPKDQGRKFAVNGALSEGKPRGAGIIMTTVFVLCSALFAPFSLETALYMVLIYAAMLTGYFDDAAENPWGELKKGLLDLVITAGVTANFMLHNSTDIRIFHTTIHIPAVIFAYVMLMVLAAYLWFNCSPSKILMGDAGSRSIGVFLAVISLKSADPLLFILFASVIIVDGGLGLLKLSCRRFLGMKNFMEKVRTPIHDHWRKNLGVGDTQVVVRFALIQLVIGLIALRIV